MMPIARLISIGEEVVVLLAFRSLRYTAEAFSIGTLAAVGLVSDYLGKELLSRGTRL